MQLILRETNSQIIKSSNSQIISSAAMKKMIVLFLAIVVYNTYSFAQPQHVGWLATFNTFKLDKKLSIHNDIQWRSSDEMAHTQTFLFRAGLNVALNKSVVATGGYAYISNRRTVADVTGYAPEHRIWEQLLINHKISRVFTAHRFRLEQRFMSKPVVENNDLKTDGTAYANRFRYFIRNVLPLKKSDKFTKGAFLALQNEVFLNIGNKANVNGETFDQNRLYLAAGYRISPRFDLEAGYLNQYINGRDDAFTNVHVVQVAGYVRL